MIQQIKLIQISPLLGIGKSIRDLERRVSRIDGTVGDTSEAVGTMGERGNTVGDEGDRQWHG